MKHGSLFSGIGGFDLAAEWMGWENIFHCEWNEFGQKVLKHYWPQAISYADITKTDFTIHRDRIDILTGGFPCQPYSQAGKRLGKEDDRHLWPEMLRAIREISPRWIVGENVRGLTNWNGGLVFDEVQADLETEGYEVTPFLLPACAVNAPHRRDRIWFVAYASDNNRRASQSGRNETRQHVFSESKRFSLQRTTSDTNSNVYQRGLDNRGNTSPAAGSKSENEQQGKWNKDRERVRVKPGTSGEDATDTNGFRLRGQSDGAGKSRFFSETGEANNWNNFPTQPPVCNGNDELSSRLDGITFSKWRNESIKAGGNAVVPQLVYQIFKAIEQYETHKQAS